MKHAWMLVGCVGCGAAESTGVPTTTPTTGPAADWPDAWAAAEAEVLDLVNERRFIGAQCGDQPMPGGQPPLEMDGLLRGIARLHSQDMADRAYFDHINPDGDDPFDRMSAAGFRGGYPWGENIAYGLMTAEGVVDGWMGSPPHCENIMLGQYGVIGIGLFEDPDVPGGAWWTQDFAGTH